MREAFPFNDTPGVLLDGVPKGTLVFGPPVGYTTPDQGYGVVCFECEVLEAGKTYTFFEAGKIFLSMNK